MISGKAKEDLRVPVAERPSLLARAGLRASFEIPLLGFLLSAFLGTIIAYDPKGAWPRLAWIIAGLCFAALVAKVPDSISSRFPRRRQVGPLAVLFGVLPTVVAVYLVSSYDWLGLPTPPSASGGLDYVTWFQSKVGLSLPNSVAGGIIAALLPLQMRSLSGLWRVGEGGRVAAVFAVALSIVGIGLSKAHATWLVLPTVGAVWCLWSYGRPSVLRARGVRWERAARMFWLVVIAATLSTLVVLVVYGPVREFLLEVRPDRAAVWRNSLDLAGDYPLTGVGLGGFPMAYSSYVLLVHVPHTFHAHNLFLDLHLQQGLLGLLTFVAWLVVAARPGGSGSPWAPAARAALGVVLLHGLVDDPFFGYGGEAAALLFLPLGLLARNRVVAIRAEETVGTAQRRWMIQGAAAAAGVAALLVAVLAPGSRAALLANAGALAQTRAELSVFRWPEYPIQDELRLMRRVNVDTPRSFYREALDLNPANVTANRRLGQIELSLGRYDEAVGHLRAALEVAPHQRATRQLLAEAYAVTGQIDDAAALIRVTDNDVGQLGLRHWWYKDYLHDTDRAANLERARSVSQR